MNLFNRHREILDQINVFIQYKHDHCGYMAALRHKEWLMKFQYLTPKNSIYKVTEADVYLFKEKMLDLYAGDFVIAQAIHSVNCLLRFYKRYSVIRITTTAFGKVANRSAM